MRSQLTALCLSSVFLLTTAPAFAALGETKAVEFSPLESGVTGEPSAALTRALDSIEVDNLRADLHFLASDEMRGRDTPSPEQRIAARYIASRLQRLGWQPGAKDGYLWEYELPTAAIDGAESRLVATRGERTLKLGLGTDYAFNSRYLSDVDATGSSIVCVGTGTEEEFDKLELEGKWALCTSSDMDTRKISRYARSADAMGVLLLPGSGIGESEMMAQVEAYAAESTVGRLSRGRGGRAAYPFLYMTTAGANKLYELAGVSEMKLGNEIQVSLTEKRVTVKNSTAGLENVIGLWPGSDPKLKQELIILSAHYDHVGTGSDGAVYNGADDNGSGTVGLLSVAESLAEYGPMRRSVMLIWVSGEEKGLLGSKAWTQDPYLHDGLKPVANINMDMIGRNASRSLLVTPTKDHDAYNGLTKLAESFRADEGFDELKSADAYWSRSDHANFSRNLDIPVAFLFADVHEDYHKPTDTPDKIDYDKIRRVSRLVVRIVDALQTDTLDL